MAGRYARFPPPIAKVIAYSVARTLDRETEPTMTLRVTRCVVLLVALWPFAADGQQAPPTAPAGVVPPDQNLPPHIRSSRLRRVRRLLARRPAHLFLSKTFGDAMEIDLATGVVSNLTSHFPHHGFTRALYLSNGHILLWVRPVRSRRRWRGPDHCWLFVLDPASRTRPPPLGVKAAEGPVPSRKRMHIAWSYRAAQFPGGDMPPGSSRMLEADIVYETGTRGWRTSGVLDSRDLQFRARWSPRTSARPPNRN